jgi:predicted RNA-binding protein YlxR (DUF448 family)
MRTPHNDRVSSDSAETGPERKCILSGSHGVRDDLIRLAIAPPDANGACQVLPDVQARAPGRGAWIGVTRTELEKALAKGKLKGALMRAFGKSLDGGMLAIPDDLPQRIETALTRVLADRLGLELRAGKLVLGSDRIAEQARAGKIVWLGHAADAAEDGSRKLDQAWRVGREEEGSGISGDILPLDRAALSVALGRDNVVHLALSDRAAANRIVAPLKRLLDYQARAEANAADMAGAEMTGAETNENPTSMLVGPSAPPLSVTTN